MKPIKYVFTVIALCGVTVLGLAQQQESMSFFVTSEPIGDGGNLGGLAGADAHCQALAAAAGSGDATWRAYLSQAPINGLPQVDARDRIGDGPWHNASGVIIASNSADLHEDRNNVRKYTALNENGDEVNGRGDQPNRHDILTGSDSMGRLPQGNAADTTCSNYTSNGDGHVRVGHHDRDGGPNASWNSTHNSRSCSHADLQATGGDGLLYCFAAD
jgi:hypothetical protein